MLGDQGRSQLMVMQKPDDQGGYRIVVRPSGYTAQGK